MIRKSCPGAAGASNRYYKNFGIKNMDKFNNSSRQPKVLCFGELIIRPKPDSYCDWISRNVAPVYLEGAEANVATALGNWGVPVVCVMAAKMNEITRQLTRCMEEKGNIVPTVYYQGECLNFFYITSDQKVKNAAVVRREAALSGSNPQVNSVDWELILEEITWFHFSAISLSSSDGVAEICLEGLSIARKKGITISMDLDYDPALCRNGGINGDLMTELVGFCNVMMCNASSAVQLFNIPVDQATEGSMFSGIKSARLTGDFLFNKFPDCNVIAQTVHLRSMSGHRKWFATLEHKEKGMLFAPFSGEGRSVSRKENGNFFMAGLIYGICRNLPFNKLSDFPWLRLLIIICSLNSMNTFFR